MTLEVRSPDGSVKNVPLVCRIDTLDELEYFRNGGILPYVLRRLAAA
jgi:aconitate hydratase